MSVSLNKVSSMRRRLDAFLKDMWMDPMAALFTPRGLLQRATRTLHLVVDGALDKDLRLHAASLTYGTLIAIVPVLALSLSALKGLGYDNQLQELIVDKMADMPEQIRSVADQMLQAVAQANFAKIGGVGALVLVFTAVQMLTRIENTFNHIWGVTEQRSLPRRFSNYISVLVVVPLLLTTTLGLTAQFRLSEGFVSELGLMRFIPFLATWLAFSFIYGTLPNTRVKVVTAILAGLIGAVVWHLWLRLYIQLQPGVTRTNVVYGTLAFLPIFLVWLYFNWLIVLLGAKIAFGIQNGNPSHPMSSKTSYERAIYGVTIMSLICERFQARAPAPSLADLVSAVDLNTQDVQLILDELKREGYVSTTGISPAGWLPAVDPRQVKMSEIVTRFCGYRGEDLTEEQLAANPDGLVEAKRLWESWEQSGRELDADLGRHDEVPSPKT